MDRSLVHSSSACKVTYPRYITISYKTGGMNRDHALFYNNRAKMRASIELRSDNSEKIHYEKEQIPIYIKRGLLSWYPDFAAVSHWHNELEFIRVFSGEMNYRCGDRTFVLTPGNGIFVNSCQLHYGWSPMRRECDFLCVLLHPILLCANAWTEETFVLPLIRNAALPGMPLLETVPWQREILDMLQTLYENKNAEEIPLLAQGQFFRIAAGLFPHMPENGTCLRDGRDPLTALRLMIGFIQRNYTRKVTLAEIAAEGCVCKSLCCSIFRKHLQQSPVDYLIRYRLLKSVELLRGTKSTVAEIGNMVGFSGASYYAEMFHRWAGCSPLKYRKDHHPVDGTGTRNQT